MRGGHDAVHLLGGQEIDGFPFALHAVMAFTHKQGNIDVSAERSLLQRPAQTKYVAKLWYDKPYRPAPIGFQRAGIFVDMIILFAG